MITMLNSYVFKGSFWFKEEYTYEIYFRGDLTGEYKHNKNKHNLTEEGANSLYLMLMSGDHKDIDLGFEILKNTNFDIFCARIIQRLSLKSERCKWWLTRSNGWSLTEGKNREDNFLKKRIHVKWKLK